MNLKMKIEFDENYKIELIDFFNNCQKIKIPGKDGDLKQRQLLLLKEEINLKFPHKAVEYLKKKYYDEGYGLKMIARALDLSYTLTRKLFRFCNIEIRKGRNVVTDNLKKFRSERVQGELNPWYDWTSKAKDGKFKNNSRGIQGYYLSKNNGYVWLRSTYEYIYLKWLDKNNINFKYELNNFKLSDGTSYRPDFFIYDDDNNLSHIVEIKGYFDNRTYKTKLLENEYNIKVIVIKDILQYTDKSYDINLKEWKKCRLLKKELKK